MLLILGITGFLKTLSFLIIMIEASLLLEEFFRTRMGFRKGFSGASTSLFKATQRHLLKALRMEGSFSRTLSWSLGCVFVVTAAGLLPSWGGEAPLSCDHSIWVYLAAKMALPMMALVFEWRLNEGRGWPTLLVSAERAIGSATVLFILGLTLIEMTGVDSFVQLRDLQNQHASLLVRYPVAIVIMFAFIVIHLFMSSQNLFAQYVTGEKQEGWNLNEFTPQLARASWSLFVVNVFIGGSTSIPVLDDVLLMAKCIFVMVMSTLLSQLFLRLREDQAENFIVWRMAPLLVFILALSLLLSGGRL